MTLFAGVVHFDGKRVSNNAINSMLEVISSSNTKTSAAVNLGWVGFSCQKQCVTTNELYGDLPLWEQAAGLLLVGHFRLDNRSELFTHLGQYFHTNLGEISDAKLLLTAYQLWGDNCPQYLLGEFAYAIWDARNQELFCVRDHIGTRAFYYLREDSSFLFGSEIKSILAYSGKSGDVCEEKIADYLLQSLQDKSLTFYKGIYRLPPAHQMKVSMNGIVLKRYWSLDATRELYFEREEDYVEQFRTLFVDAVRCRMRGDAPLGCFLSGGLDSSAIACNMRMLLDTAGNTQPLQTFSAIYPEVPESDEREFIDIILTQGGFEPNFVCIDQLSPLGGWTRMVRQLEEPVFLQNMFMSWGLFSAAKQQGVKVLLSGIDGDLVVSHGFARLAELAANGQWQAFAEAGIALSHYFESYPTITIDTLFSRYATVVLKRRFEDRQWFQLWRDLSDISNYLSISQHDILRRHLLPGLMPQHLKKKWARLRGHIHNSKQNKGVRPEFIEQPQWDRLRNLKAKWLQAPLNAREEHLRLLESGLLSCALETMQRTAAIFDLELRYPFLDKRLIEFCLALPSRYKLDQGWSRLILRLAMDGILPDAVCWRKDKSNLSKGFYHSLLKFERTNLTELTQSKLLVENYVDVQILRKVTQNYFAKHTASNLLWSAVALELWLRERLE
jgi:asparagine synthase (glutamine-hydrolysing)